MTPTYEQLAAATRLSSYTSSYSNFFWISTDTPTLPANVHINLSDTWSLASADCEQIAWEHMFFYEEGLLKLDEEYMALPSGKEHDSKKFDRWAHRCHCFSIAYAAIMRESEPEAWLNYFKYEGTRPFGAYRPISVEERQDWEEMKAWWAERLRPKAA